MAQGKSEFRLTANSQQYVGEIGKAQAATEGLGSSTKKVTKSSDGLTGSIKKLSPAITQARERANSFAKVLVTAGAAMTTALVVKGLQSADQLAKVSDKLGITTEGLAGLRLAAELTGNSTRQLDMGLQRMVRRIAEAAQGTGEAKNALKELGLSATELAALKPDEAFKKVSEAMGGVASQSDKVRLGFKLFDAEGVGLVNTLALGADGLAEVAEQADAAGLAISRIEARKIEMANDAITLVKSQFTGFSQQLAVQFAPVLTGIAERLFQIGTESGGMAKAAEKAFQFMVDAVGIFADGLHGISIIFDTLELGVRSFALLFLESWDKILGAVSYAASLIPGIDVDYESSTFAEFVEDFRQDTFDSVNDYHDKLQEPLPSEAIGTFVTDTRESFESVAESAGIAMVDVDDIVGTGLVETTKKVKKETTAWEKALTGTAERIDDAFANAWKGAFDSFKDFGDSILDAFKNLLAEMAHLAITRPIAIGLSASLGFGSSAAGAAMPSLGGVASGVGSFLSNPLGFVGGGIDSALRGAGGWAAGQGLDSLSSMFYNSTTGLAQTGSLVGGGVGAGALLSGGAGILGGMLGNSLFGPTSGVGSTLGSVGGTVFGSSLSVLGAAGGPIGAAVGALLGSGLESLLGGKPSDKTGTALLDLSSGSVDIGGLTGSKFSQENRDAAGDIAETFKMFGDAVGGSSARLDIGVGNRDGLRLDGRDYGDDIDGFLEAGFDKILASAENLNPALRNMIDSFDGTTEEAVLFAAALVDMQGQIDVNVVQQARDAFTELNSAASSATGIYGRHADALQDLISGFDGSVQGASQLNAALGENRQMAFQLATAILQTSASVDEMLGESAQRIRESVMSTGELRRARLDERTSLIDELRTLSDPQEIRAVVDDIERVNSQIFNALSPEQQVQRAEGFAKQIENVNDLAQERLEGALVDLESKQLEINDQLGALLADGAQQMANSANAFGAAANTFGAWVNKLQAQGIPVDITLGSPEVNVG